MKQACVCVYMCLRECLQRPHNRFTSEAQLYEYKDCLQNLCCSFVGWCIATAQFQGDYIPAAWSCRYVEGTLQRVI